MFLPAAPVSKRTGDVPKQAKRSKIFFYILHLGTEGIYKRVDVVILMGVRVQTNFETFNGENQARKPNKKRRKSGASPPGFELQPHTRRPHTTRQETDQTAHKTAAHETKNLLTAQETAAH